MRAARGHLRNRGIRIALALPFVLIFLSGSNHSVWVPGDLAGRSDRDADRSESNFAKPRKWAICDRHCPERPEPFELTTDYLYPKLRKGVSHYVTNCLRGGTEMELNSERRIQINGPGFEWRGRAGHVRVPLSPGESFVLNSAGHRYRIRCLPANFPGWDFERMESPSHKFYSVAFGRSNDNEDKNLNPFVVVFDRHGVPVWWQDEDEGTLGGQVVEYEGSPYIYWRQEGHREQSFIEDYHQLHTLDGKLAYQFESPRLSTDGHEFNLRKNGDVWLDSYAPRPDTDFTAIGGPDSAWSAEAIVERVRDGRTIWRWSTRRAIHPYEARRSLGGKFDEKSDGSYEDPYDRVHLNSVEPAGDRVIVSLRNTDAVYGIDRATGDVAWKLGGEETPESLRTIGDSYRYPSGAQHDARVLPDGTLSVFDNRSGLGQPPRVTRWRIDEKTMTATLVEEYEDPVVTNSPATGSARFSRDGSLFVYWGDSYLMTEFSPEGSIAFRLSVGGMAYRAYPVPDGLVGYRDFDRGMAEKSG